MEAVDEINFSLKEAKYDERITEDDLVAEDPVEKIDPDDFDDCDFTFAININDTPESIKEKLCGTGVDVETEEDYLA